MRVLGILLFQLKKTARNSVLYVDDVIKLLNQKAY